MDAENQRESRIDELVFGYLERAEEEPLDAARRLDALCAEHPELADELRRRVELLVGSGLWSPPSDGAAMPERLGEFRILRRLGQGGMGVVFLAEQESVGRRVALKLIRNEALFVHGTRLRFLREAQAIARLDHPGIVRVHTVGEAAGAPYFAMEFVAGAPLDALVDAWQGREPRSITGADVRAAIAASLVDSGAREPPEWDEAHFERPYVEIVVRAVHDVALALHHAHQRGVLHRDVKPSNVLLTPSGRVRLLDFGLASLASSQTITRTGTQIGSVTYMSPEQLDGRRSEVGPASDVYGLGVTLYEMLALRLPFAGESYEEIRARILDARPAPLRSSNPNVNADVETICAKAMERDARNRYPTAEALARDLENVLELRPIAARRPSTAQRVARWTQRRPASATAVVLGAMLLVAGPVGYELSRRSSSDELRTANERSERDFRSALDAIRHLLRETAVEGLEDVPRMQIARLQAVDRALEQYRELEVERADDLELLAEGGALHTARGEVLRDLGRPEEALAEFQLAVAAHRRVVARDPSPTRETFVGAALMHSGKAHSAVGNAAAAVAIFEEARAIAERASQAAPERADRRLAVVKADLAIAEAHRILGALEPGSAAAERALELALATDGASPHPESAWCVARAHEELAATLLERQELSRAAEHGELALAAYRRAHSSSPDSRFYAYDVSAGCLTVAIHLGSLGDFERAEEAAREGLEIVDRLLRDFPESDRYRKNRLDLLEELATCAGRQNRYEEAHRMLVQCVEEREREFTAHPDRCDLAVLLAKSLANCSISSILRHVELETSLAQLVRAEKALAVCRVLAEPPGIVAELEDQIAYNRALAVCFLDRRDEALALVRDYAKSAPIQAMPQRMSADLWSEFLLCLERRGEAGPEADEAVRETFAALKRAIDAGYADLGEMRSNPALERFRRDPRWAALMERVKVRNE